MQVFPVGGWEASAGSHLIRYVPVRWSHKHRNCSWLPLARQHRQGIIWSTSWYHGLLTLLVSLSVGDPQIGTWIENGNANLRLSFWDTSSRSAFVHLLLLKGVSTAPHRLIRTSYVCRWLREDVDQTCWDREVRVFSFSLLPIVYGSQAS